MKLYMHIDSYRLELICLAIVSDKGHTFYAENNLVDPSFCDSYALTYCRDILYYDIEHIGHMYMKSNPDDISRHICTWFDQFVGAYDIIGYQVASDWIILSKLLESTQSQNIPQFPLDLYTILRENDIDNIESWCHFANVEYNNSLTALQKAQIYMTIEKQYSML